MPQSAITNQQRWIRAFILIFGAMILLCFLFADPLLRTFRKQDLKDAHPQEGVATIVTLVVPDTNEEGQTSQPLVGVRFRNGVHTAQHAYDIKNLRLGQPAQIVYRVGKSGTVVVDSVAPIASSH